MIQSIHYWIEIRKIMESIERKFEQDVLKLQSTDLEVVEQAVRGLGQLNDGRAIPILIEMPSREKDNNVRNALALSLGQLKANEAVPLLMELIKTPELRNKRGSLVFALKDLDCREHFYDFVEMICDGNCEVSNHALEIFESLVDEASFSNKLLARERLKSQEQIEVTMPPSKHPKYDKIHFIRDALKALDD